MLKSLYDLFNPKEKTRKWFNGYASEIFLSQEDRKFLESHTLESFTALIPTDILIGCPRKINLPGAIMIIRHHEATGVWIYPPDQYPYNW